MERKPDLGQLSPRERLLFWIDLAAKEAETRGELAKQQADLEAAGLRIAAHLLDVENGQFRWRGPSTEILLAERPEFEADEADDHEASKRAPWPVNVDKALLARMRSTGYDLEDALQEHARVGHTRNDVVFLTAHRMSAGWFAILTAVDSHIPIEATHAFAPDRLPEA